jgi:tetratricopeptide (TPR) repeat protein
MRADAIVFGVAGSLFGLIIGWVLGSQNAAGTARLAAPVAQAAPAAAAAPAQPQPAPLDPARVQALQAAAEKDPKDVQSRVQLGNLFFDAEQYPQAINWYEQSLTLNPADANVSTDLGVAYYYTNQADRALAQFDKSLAVDPRHIKTLLNVGIVRAFGKQDLAGAAKAWEQVVAISPDSPEGQAAKKGLEGVKNAQAAPAGGK